MTHGIEAFFSERARARRRVAMNTVLTGAVVLAALGIVNLPPVSRALPSQSQVPIFQSNDLIIERLVRPTYPEDARDQGLEGKVAVLARVDTAGQVIEAEVMTGSGALQLDRAAEEAVRQCRFRPYRVAGEAPE